MKKVFKLMAVLAALALTACNKAAEETPADESSAPAHKHKYVEDPSLSVAATCMSEGKTVSVCSCGDKKETPIPKIEHTWGDKLADSAEEAGIPATEQYKCSQGDHYALRWSAIALDEEATVAACGLEAKDTSIYPEINESGSHAGTMRLQKAENDGGTEKKGTHAVYKIKLSAAAENIGLAFLIDPKSGYEVPIFDYVSGDAQQGYVKKDDGTLELTTKRYGLRVNGQEVVLGADNYGDVNGGTNKWYSWAVSFNLNAGVNTIDVYCLGGYRAYIHNFQLQGLPAAALPAAANA